MIITLKDKDSVYVATSTPVCVSGTCIENGTLEDNASVWRMVDREDTILAATRAFAFHVDLLRYKSGNEFCPSTLSQKSVVTKLIPTMTQLYDEIDALDDDNFWESYVIAKGNRAFEIASNKLCMEVHDISVIGRGWQIAHGTMITHQDKPPIERIVQAFRMVERTERDCQFPIVIMNTKQKERIVIDR